MIAESVYQERRVEARSRDAHGIEEAARAALAAHSHFRGRADHFVLLASAETLVVSGAVPTFYLKQLLQSILRRVAGVERVQNRVAVINPQGISIIPRHTHRWELGEGGSVKSCASNQN